MASAEMSMTAEAAVNANPQVVGSTRDTRGAVSRGHYGSQPSAAFADAAVSIKFSERPGCVPTVLECLHRRERRVGEAAKRVAAVLTGGQRRGAVAREVEGVDDGDVIEPHVACVVLLVVGEDHRALVLLGVEPSRDRRVTKR